MIKTVSGERYALPPDFLLSSAAKGGQGSPALTSLGSNGFLALWTEDLSGGVRMQRFDINGTRIGPEIQLAGHGAQAAPTLDGGFVVTWTANGPWPATFDIKAQKFDAGGTAMGDAVTVNTRIDGFQISSRIALLANGNYVIAWDQPEDYSSDHVRYQILDSSLQKVGPESIATEARPGDTMFEEVIALADGGFAIAWHSYNTEVIDQWGNTSPGLRAQIFNSDGSRRGEPFSLNTIVAGSQSMAELAALPNGGFVASWSDDGSANSGQPANGNQGVWVQLFDAQGNKAGTEVKASSLGSRYEDSPTIAVTAGGFIVFWREIPQMYSAVSSIRGQAFDLGGNKVGEEFTVDSSATATELMPEAITLTNGAVVVAWQNREPTGSQQEDVRAQMLFPTAHGTEGPDVHSGGAGRDFYFGHGGNDSLSGGGAGDGLTGGDGDDVLNGGDGDDILDGGSGADSMTGGAGDDFYTVHQAGDAVVEYAGEGLDTVETSLADYAAPDSVENVIGTLGAGMAQILRGNALGNVLTGGEADNIFHVGSGGHDVVKGNGGRDTLYIDWSDSISPVTNDIHGTPFPDKPGAAYTDGTVRSVVYTRVETVEVRTGAGNDSIATPGWHPLYGPPITRLSTGAGDDIAYLNSTLDSFDGGSGIDGVYAGNVDISADPFEWRVPSNLFVSPAGTPQFANVEYFIQGSTGSGNDIVETGRFARTDRLETLSGDDLVIFYDGRDSLLAGAGYDTLVIDWRDSNAPVSLYSHLLSGSLNGGADSGTGRSVTFSDVERLVLYAGSAADSIAGTVLSDRLSGGDGGDTITGGFGDDSIDGDSGDDILSGGSGMDLLSGGEGDDLLRGGSGVDSFDGGGNWVLGWGDSISFIEQAATQGAVADLRTGIISNDGFGNAETMTGIESLWGGTAFADTFYGNDDLNLLVAGLGDFVHGFGGIDRIEAGLAPALIDGGAGNDSLHLGTGEGAFLPDSNGDGFAEKSPAMTQGWKVDLLAGTVRDGFGNVGTVTGIEDIFGSLLADDLRGDSGDNLIFADAGNDVLRLQDGGDDRVFGGGGADNIFFLGSLTSADYLLGGEGTDTLILQGDYSGGLLLTANVSEIENISILGGGNMSFGEPGTNRYDYSITLNDANFAAGVQARINGSALLAEEDFVFDGSAETDAKLVVYGGRGKDTLTGGQSFDIFFFAEGRFATGDTVNGGAGYDGMFLRGNYTIDFNAPGYTGLFTNIENLTLTSATDERYARGGGTEFDYNLVLSNAIVKPGETLTVSGTILMASETMILDASQETDGMLRLFGGKAADTLKGGALADLIHGNLGADSLAGNGGADSFRYQATAESDAANMDQITDFTAGTDSIDLSRIDANSVAAGDQGFSWIGSNAFSGTAGELRAYEQGGTWFVEGDVDGNSVADLVISLTLQGPTPLSAGDFLL